MSPEIECKPPGNTARVRSLEAHTAKVMDDVAGIIGDMGVCDIQEGDRGRVLLYPSAELPVVAKISLGSDSSFLSREAALLEYLGQRQRQHPSPVQIPDLLWHDYDFTYNALSYVPGAPLKFQELRNLSEAEKVAFGKQVGSFVCWLDGAIDLSTYRQLMQGYPRPHDKVHEIFLNRGLANSGELDAVGQHVLASACELLDDDYMNFRRTGAITPNMVGHDDLNPGNLLFCGSEGGHRLQGIIDFELTKPSSVERELRFLPFIGIAALQAATETCEGLLHRPVRPELIQFWERVQVTTLAVKAVTNNRPKAHWPLLRQRLEAVWTGWEGSDWREFA